MSRGTLYPRIVSGGTLLGETLFTTTATLVAVTEAHPETIGVEMLVTNACGQVAVETGSSYCPGR